MAMSAPCVFSFRIQAESRRHARWPGSLPLTHAPSARVCQAPSKERVNAIPPPPREHMSLTGLPVGGQSIIKARTRPATLSLLKRWQRNQKRHKCWAEPNKAEGDVRLQPAALISTVTDGGRGLALCLPHRRGLSPELTLSRGEEELLSPGARGESTLPLRQLSPPHRCSEVPCKQFVHRYPPESRSLATL